MSRNTNVAEFAAIDSVKANRKAKRKAKQAAVVVANTANDAKASKPKASAAITGKATAFVVKHGVGRKAGEPISRRLAIVHAMWKLLAASPMTADQLAEKLTSLGFDKPAAVVNSQLKIETGGTGRKTIRLNKNEKTGVYTIAAGITAPGWRTANADGSQKSFAVSVEAAKK